MIDRTSIDYGQRADKLWHAYQAMQAKMTRSLGQRDGAWLVIDASPNATPEMYAVVNKLDRAYTRQTHAVARLFRAYERTFEAHPYVNPAGDDSRPVTHASVAAIDAALTAGERYADATRDQSRDVPELSDSYGHRINMI
jgi:hypothetical protein